MARVDVPIRAPTFWPWMTTLASLIATGELFYEIHKPSIVSTFFGVTYSDDELWPALIALGLAAIGCAVWLVLHYVRPGKLSIDGDAGHVARLMPRGWTMRSVNAPVGEWQVRLFYFSEGEKSAGAFKRLELIGPEFREVLLFGDVVGPDALIRALDAVGARLKSYEVIVQR
jgi:hypothetical protein